MGFFSWKTQDTNRSIPNRYQNVRDTFPVYMIDNKGNRYYEPNYGGYGEFGGKDFYELMAEMNGITGNTLQESRKNAISAICDENRTDLIYPNLVENPDTWTYDPTLSPNGCEYQGFFYDDDVWEDEEDYQDNDDYWDDDDE